MDHERLDHLGKNDLIHDPTTVYISGVEKSFLSSKTPSRIDYFCLRKSYNWSNLEERGIGNTRHFDIENRIENKSEINQPAKRARLISFFVLQWDFGRPISLSIH